METKIVAELKGSSENTLSVEVSSIADGIQDELSCLFFEKTNKLFTENKINPLDFKKHSRTLFVAATSGDLLRQINAEVDHYLKIRPWF